MKIIPAAFQIVISIEKLAANSGGRTPVKFSFAIKSIIPTSFAIYTYTEPCLKILLIH